jgi:hypothetical protein
MKYTEITHPSHPHDLVLGSAELKNPTSATDAKKWGLGHVSSANNAISIFTRSVPCLNPPPSTHFSVSATSDSTKTRQDLAIDFAMLVGKMCEGLCTNAHTRMTYTRVA